MIKRITRTRTKHGIYWRNSEGLLHRTKGPASIRWVNSGTYPYKDIEKYYYNGESYDEVKNQAEWEIVILKIKINNLIDNFRLKKFGP